MSEEALVICGRRDDMSTWVDDAVEGHCTECGEVVMVAPTTFPILLEEDAKIICIHCAIKHPDFQKKGVKMLNPDQIKEIAVALSKMKKPNERKPDSGPEMS